MDARNAKLFFDLGFCAHGMHTWLIVSGFRLGKRPLRFFRGRADHARSERTCEMSDLSPLSAGMADVICSQRVFRLFDPTATFQPQCSHLMQVKVNVADINNNIAQIN